MVLLFYTSGNVIALWICTALLIIICIVYIHILTGHSYYKFSRLTKKDNAKLIYYMGNPIPASNFDYLSRYTVNLLINQYLVLVEIHICKFADASDP